MNDAREPSAGGDPAAGDGVKPWWSRPAARRVFVATAVALVALAGLVISSEVAADAALAGVLLTLLAIALVAVVVVPPEELAGSLRKVKSVSLASLVSVEFDYKELAERTSPEPSGEGDADAARTLSELRTRLEMKLTYLAKHVLAPNPDPETLVPTFLTVGSLVHDGLLDTEQARVAHDILTMREYEFQAMTADDREAFLKVAGALAANVRIDVFAVHVEQELERLGWELERPSAKRRDLLVTSGLERDATQHHVIPNFSQRKTSHLLTKPVERLETSASIAGGGRRFVVVPPRSKAAGPAGAKTLDGGVEVVKLANLLEILGKAPKDESVPD